MAEIAGGQRGRPATQLQWQRTWQHQRRQTSESSRSTPSLGTETRTHQPPPMRRSRQLYSQRGSTRHASGEKKKLEARFALAWRMKHTTPAVARATPVVICATTIVKCETPENVQGMHAATHSADSSTTPSLAPDTISTAVVTRPTHKLRKRWVIADGELSLGRCLLSLRQRHQTGG